MPDDTPHVIAERYELTHPISSGGMAQVWLGYDRRLDRPIAVKLIRSDLAADTVRHDEVVDRFRREARVTANIEHPGVPAIYDADFDASVDKLFLVMQYLPGHDLSDLIAEAETMPVEWAVSIAAQVASVLSYAHEVPVVHRDLKPRNIRLGSDGRVWVLDFGIAAVLETDVTKLTTTGHLIGTLPYMAPEQVLAGQITPRTDLYGLGCLIHEMLCGQRVFTETKDFQLMEAHLRQTPVGLRQLRRDVPEPIETLVLELLAKNPEDRPGSAADVCDRLRPFLPTTVKVPARAAVGEFGDPTVPFRTPLAPRASGAATAVPATLQRMDASELQEVVNAAKELMVSDRYTQASRSIAEVLQAAEASLGRRHDTVLHARRVRAVALILGGGYQEALPEFEALATIYASLRGALHVDALNCRRQAAYCLANLGRFAEALSSFEALVPDLSANSEIDVAEQFEARRTIAQLQDALGHHKKAVATLEALREDMSTDHRATDVERRQVAVLLQRWRAAGQEPSPPDWSSPGTEAEWEQVRKETLPDPHLRSLVEALAAVQAPIPVVGYELGDDAWLAELAWPEQKLAVLLDDSGGAALAGYIRRGWRAKFASEYSGRELVAMLEGQS